METLITAAAFAAITAISIALHVRGKNRAGAAPRAASTPCPRCGLRVPARAERCPSCGVPLQAYELVSAGVATGAAGAPTTGGPAHAIVRADTCVGCGACVAACPEPGAIRLEGKIAVVDLARCKGHGECATACPVGGIVVASGAAVQRVETPFLDAHFETNVPGLYVVGELGGRGLIKNAINEGKIAIEEVARRVRATPRPAGVPDLVDVVVVGSGPAGLSAGLEALRQKLDYVLLERGDLSDTIRRYPRHKILMAEPVKVPLYGDLWVADASKESLLNVWQTIVSETGLVVRTGRAVQRVEGRSGWVEVTATAPTGLETYRACHVVLALGRRGTPRKLEVAGEELPKVFYDVVEMEAFARSRVLVVGGGDSAIEVVVGLARQPGTTVTLSYRGEAFTRIKDRNRSHLEETRAARRVELLLKSRVREIRADSVLLDVDGAERVVGNDYVIVRAGGVPPFDFLRAAGVRIVTKEIAIGGAPEPAAA